MDRFSPGILHPTDFSEASEVAFAHALAIALADKAKLTLIHAERDAAAPDWRRFPAVRRTLERWGCLAEGSPKAAVFDELSLRVRKVAVEGSDPGDAVLGYLEKHPEDLIVLTTEQSGLPAFLEGSVARRVAREAGIDTLFVPEGVRGFVAPEDGTLSLRRILLPVADQPDSKPAVESAAWAAHWLGDGGVAIHVLHVGDALPALALPEGEGWSYETHLRSGDPVDEILAAARELDADLILMATDGREGFLDALHGSHAEQVVQGAPCPVATIASS